MGETVLVPIDGSPLSQKALRHALEKFPDAAVIAYHVVNIYEPAYDVNDTSIAELLGGSGKWDEIEREAADHLLSKADEIAAEYDREIDTESAIGDPQRLIPEYARENAVDHIVMGVHGRAEEDRSLVGQVAETVVFRSPVSVTIIR
ncbi:universal stress protein [Natronoarchaeum sp. GCM10025703]|uniref:universal stress protein n=1 Tax=unclassified Natronoarchaeum TaxID=2620183 RepID=UPI00361DCC27